MNAALMPQGWGFGLQLPLPKTRPGRGWGLSAAARDLRAADPALLRCPTAVLAGDLRALYGLDYHSAYRLVERERHAAAQRDARAAYRLVTGEDYPMPGFARRRRSRAVAA